MIDNKMISEAMTIKLDEIFDELPPMPKFQEGIRRAPKGSSLYPKRRPKSL